MRDTRKSSNEMKERKCNGLSSKTLASQEKEPRKPRKNANAAIKYFFPKINKFPESDFPEELKRKPTDNQQTDVIKDK